jgi:hypothetical protein
VKVEDIMICIKSCCRGKGREMTQTFYSHMNKRKKKRKLLYNEGWEGRSRVRESNGRG